MRIACHSFASGGNRPALIHRCNFARCASSRRTMNVSVTGFSPRVRFSVQRAGSRSKSASVRAMSSSSGVSPRATIELISSTSAPAAMET